MARKGKVDMVKELIDAPVKIVFSDEEIRFLKDRGINTDDLVRSKRPLIIYSGDDEQTVAMIKTIATRLDYPMIRFAGSDAGSSKGGNVVNYEKPEDPASQEDTRDRPEKETEENSPPKDNDKIIVNLSGPKTWGDDEDDDYIYTKSD